MIFRSARTASALAPSLTTALGALGLVVAVTGCSSQMPVDPQETSSVASPIIGGAADTTHDAVVAIISQQGNQAGACTGTIVKVNGQVGYVLTAAHCVSPIAPTIVLMGDDYGAASAKRYDVLDYAAHPSYNGDVASNFDVAVIRILGTNANTPVIPITDSPDGLSIGTTLTSVGYGRTTPIGSASTDNTIRKVIKLPVRELDTDHLGYQYQSGNICQGDSGGPALRGAAGQERVVGVHSYVTGDCTQGAYSVRITFPSDYQFIQQQLAKAPPADSCDICTRAQNSGDNICAQKQDACLQDPQCEALANCEQACTSTSCVEACENKNPRGIAKLHAAQDCSCGAGVCKTQCGLNCRAPTCGYRIAKDACGTCTEGSCCDALAACAYDTDCLLCLRAGADAPETCASNTLRKAVADCVATKCKTDCAADPIGQGGQPQAPDGGASPSDPGSTTTTTTTQSCGCETVGAPAGSSLPASGALALVASALFFGRRRRGSRKSEG